MVPIRIRIAIVFQNLPGNSFPFFFGDDLPGDQFHFRIGTGEVQELAAKGNRWAGRTGMYFFRSAFKQELCGFPQLRSPNNGIVDQDDTFAFNQFVYRNQFHLGNQVPFALNGWHKRPGPGRRVFDQRTRERNPAFIGIAHRMGDTGIRNTGYIIHCVFPNVIPPGHIFATVVPHLFHGYTFIERRRISVIHPHKRADPHFGSGFCQHLHTFRRHDVDFSGT